MRLALIGTALVAGIAALFKWQDRADLKRWGPPVQGWRDLTPHPIIEYGYDD